MVKRKNYAGQVFNGVKILSFSHMGKNSRQFYRCKCHCGKEFVTGATAIITGHTRSCGCLHEAINKETSTTHGDSYNRLYKTWLGMKSRCNYTNNGQYKDYGGRGIVVCKEWQEDYLAFKTWALESGYEDHLTIERVDNDKGYFPENCRWITMREQSWNRTNTRYITINGVTKSLGEWCFLHGINYNTAKGRLRRGWEPGEALTNKNKMKNQYDRKLRFDEEVRDE